MAKLLKSETVKVELFETDDGKFQVVATCEGLRGAYTPMGQTDAELLFEMLKHHDCPKCGDRQWAERKVLQGAA